MVVVGIPLHLGVADTVTRKMFLPMSSFVICKNTTCDNTNTLTLISGKVYTSHEEATKRMEYILQRMHNINPNNLCVVELVVRT